MSDQVTGLLVSSFMAILICLIGIVSSAALFKHGNIRTSFIVVLLTCLGIFSNIFVYLWCAIP